MKTKALFSLVLIVAVSMCKAICVQAQAPHPDKQAIAMLRRFYTAYFEAWSRPPTLDNLKRIKAIQKEFCTVSFYNKLIAQYKSKYVGADPFTQSQDIDIVWLKALSFNKDLRELDGYNVSYVETTSNEKVVIHLIVVKQGENFKVLDIR